MSRRAAFIGVVLAAIAVAVSGIAVARVAHEVRTLHGELERTRHAQDALMAEYSRLLLERSAIAAYQNVERIAQDELAMQFPNQVEYLSR